MKREELRDLVFDLIGVLLLIAAGAALMLAYFDVLTK